MIVFVYVCVFLYCSEVELAGESLLQMRRAVMELRDEGVPVLCGMELYRRILDAHIPESSEILVTEEVH